MFHRSQGLMRAITLTIAALIICPYGSPFAHEASNAGLAAKAPGVDLTHLPVGDTRITTTPRAGWIWACGGGMMNERGTPIQGPWIKPDGTYDLLAKAVIRGEVTWPHHFVMTIEGDKRVFTSNDLPDHTTGVFPVQRDDPAYAVDRNPNGIRAQDMRIAIPLNPVLAEKPGCLPGAVGITLTGVALFDALDAEHRDAVAHEVQDSCQGHPQITGTYHYHSMTTCLEDKRTAKGHSTLMAYALDGFGVYGMYGESGKILTSADLDECHGHTHKIEWNGRVVEMYHYHATWDFPYTVGCFRGTYDFATVFAISGAGAGQRGPNNRAANLKPAADKLGISVDRLIEALGPPPPNLPAAAARLGISEETLRQAMQGTRPPGPPGGGPPMDRPPPMGMRP